MEKYLSYSKKILKSRRKLSTLGKILNSGENSQPWGKFSTLEKIFNSRENSQFWGKLSTLGKIVNSGENSQLRRKFSALEKILNSGENSQLRRKFLKVKNTSDTRNIPIYPITFFFFFFFDNVLLAANYKHGFVRVADIVGCFVKPLLFNFIILFQRIQQFSFYSFIRFLLSYAF